MSITRRIGRSYGLVGVGFLVLIAAVAARMIFPGRHSHCDQQVVREFPSPNGRSVGLVIRTNCGATTPFMASAGIRTNGKDFDLDRDAFFSIRGDGNDVELIWRDSPILYEANELPALTVIYNKPRSIYRQAIVWEMARIAYRER
jgi:hypothetical protein